MRAVLGLEYPSRDSVSRACLGLRARARYHGDSGQKGRPMRRMVGKMNCSAKGILYASADSRVPVPLRMRFAASWPMPTNSWTPDVVRPRISTGQTSEE